MAGIALGIDTIARDRTTPDPSRGALRELRTETERAVGEVRRIVYGLRPPELDELGLTEALRAHADRLAGARITVDGPVPPLPAAVEVAAYRIAVEGITNAARHAAQAGVEVRLRAADDLEIVIEDDGPGLPEPFVAGVGVSAMRERAAELGGTCTVTSLRSGTTVTARLPLAVPGPVLADPGTSDVDLSGVAVAR